MRSAQNRDRGLGAEPAERVQGSGVGVQAGERRGTRRQGAGLPNQRIPKPEASRAGPRCHRAWAHSVWPMLGSADRGWRQGRRADRGEAMGVSGHRCRSAGRACRGSAGTAVPELAASVPTAESAENAKSPFFTIIEGHEADRVWDNRSLNNSSLRSLRSLRSISRLFVSSMVAVPSFSLFERAGDAPRPMDECRPPAG